MPFINIYQNDRCFSGPEEGGTYHNEWECLASHRFSAPIDSDKARKMLNRFRVQYGFTSSRHSAYSSYKTFRSPLDGKRERAWQDASSLGQIDTYEIRLESVKGSNGNSYRPYE